MTRHPDPGVLAEFREGLLSRRRSARVRTHLARCSHCAALDADLAEVTALLASAPVPRMPGQLVTRLENVLAAEAAARAGKAGLAGAADGSPAGADATADPSGPAPGTAGQPGRARIRSLPSHSGRRPGRPRLATLGMAAAIVAILAIGGYGLTRLTHPGTSSSSAGSSQLAPANRPAFHSQSSAGTLKLAPSSTGGQVRVISSGTDYQPARLAAQVEAVLASRLAHSATPLPAGSANASGLNASPRLRACVDVTTGGVQPSLVDTARYQGRPATIIVQAPAGGHAGQVWVTGPGCSAGTHDLIAHTELTGTG